MLKTYMVYLLGLFMLLSCKAQEFTPDTFPKDQLIFGTGGGITGHEKTYTLLANGQVFFMNSLTKKLESLGKADKKLVKAAFQQAKTHKILDVDYQKPGNLYRFLAYKSDSKNNRITWAEGSKTVPPAIKTIYNQLLSLIPKKSSK
ncbi:MAG: hypothetical protein ACPGJS_22535 [Flammeovirgaceae bacterium]